MEDSYVETKVEAMEGNRAKVTVTIDAVEVDAAIKSAYKEFANRYNFPGFRKGKAPRPVIDNMLGKEAARAQATDSLVNEKYPLAVDASGLYPIGQPTVNADDLVENGTAYEFTIEFDRIPDLELSDYSPVEVELPSEEVTDAEVDAQIDEFREQLAEIEDCDDDAKVEAESIIEMSIKGLDANGEEIESLTREAFVYALGMDMLPAEFDEKLIGLAEGEEVSFTLETADQSSVLLRGMSQETPKIDFEVKVGTVKRRALPEVTDEWAKENNFESVEDLRTRVRDGIKSQKQASMPSVKENACLSKLAERLEGEVPESICEQEEAQLLQNFFQQLQDQGLSFDMYLAFNNLSSEQFKEDVKKQAADIAREDMSLDAWARHKGYEVTDEDIRAEFAKSGVENPDALEKEWRAEGRLHMLRQGILRSRAAADLMESAIVTVKDPSSSTDADKGEGADEPAAAEADEPAAETQE